MRVVATFLMSMTILVSAIISGCSGAGGANAQADTLDILPDTIRVATLYSPTSYFIYRDVKFMQKLDATLDVILKLIEEDN